jgi:hypothetical protein
MKIIAILQTLLISSTSTNSIRLVNIIDTRERYLMTSLNTHTPRGTGTINSLHTRNANNKSQQQQFVPPHNGRVRE